MSDKYRVGMSQTQNIYVQTGDEPSKDDQGVGRMDNPQQAKNIVTLANLGLDTIRNNRTK